MGIASFAVLATSSAFASVLATTAVAHAQPSLVEPAAEPREAPAAGAYLEPGVEVGLTRGGFYGAVQLDGGHRRGDGPIWLHARLAHGGMANLAPATMPTDFTEARVGLEVRGCGLGSLICLVGGLDAGYRHKRLVTEYGAGSLLPQVRVSTDLVVAIARLGLDLGGKHLRLRVSVESAVDQLGWDGLGLTTGVAYAW